VLLLRGCCGSQAARSLLSAGPFLQEPRRLCSCLSLLLHLPLGVCGGRISAVAASVRALSRSNYGFQPLRAEVPLRRLLCPRRIPSGWAWPAQLGLGTGPADPEAEPGLACHTGSDEYLTLPSSTKVCGGPANLAGVGAAADLELPAPVAACGPATSTRSFQGSMPRIAAGTMSFLRTAKFWLPVH
jgi:hypothetical protein